MKITILFFGITADLVHTTHLTLDIDKDVKVASFKAVLESKYPQLKNVNSYAIAVNEAYASDDLILRENDTVAIIPPVSGG
ncbi:molybdopterin converting factor subunit 1 [uncultured Polaribacter sp.]|uniref:molybdopterin converting factor subunit 1 n=1 Tax=uncultured Polaribacter sp. TaxID=174711 RepID=UPI00261343C3|nr:molybdopterin converting factor subunit 1 [uncultured Polaribacter sp.]